MKNLATSYSYNPVNKTLTLTGLNVPLSYLLLVVNATRGTIIYNLADPALAAANFVQGANSVLTLNASVDTSFHNASDALTIFYDDGVQTNTLLIQGPAGPQGPKGDPGNDGADGLNGADGADGINGTNGVDGIDGTDGADGREVELQKSATHLQWRYLGDPAWTDLVPLADLKGDKGDPVSTEISGITGLQAALDGKAAAGLTEGGEVQKANELRDLADNETALKLYDTTVTFHGVDYDEGSEAASFRAAIGAASTSHKSTHAIGGSDALTPADIGAAEAVHTHAIADTTGLQTELDSKQTVPITNSHSFNSSNQSTPYAIPTGRVLYLNVNSFGLGGPAEIILPRSTDGAISGDRLRLTYSRSAHTQPLLVKQYQSTGNSQSPYTGTLLTLVSLEAVTTWFEFTGFSWRAEPVSLHKTTHAIGGSDALTPADIGAQTQLAFQGLHTPSNTTIISLQTNTFNSFLKSQATDFQLQLPQTATNGDRVVVSRNAGTGNGLMTIQRFLGGGGWQDLVSLTSVGQLAAFSYFNGWLRELPFHTHAIADTTGLQSALDAKASTSALAALEARVAALEAAQP